MPATAPDLRTSDGMMKREKRYRVVLRGLAAVRLPRDVVFEIPDATSLIRIESKYRQDERGTWFPGAVEVVVELTAQSAEEAIKGARQRGNLVTSLLALHGSGPIEIPEAHLIYEIRDDQEAREFQQFFFDDLGLRSTRAINLEHFDKLVTSVWKVPPDQQARISRSLRWYRSALNSDSLLERFVLLWVGFEALNPLLSAFLGVPNYLERPCPECGHPIRQPQASGAYGWIERELGEERRRKISHLRNGLLHGTASIEEMGKLAQEIAEPLRSALLSALLSLLSLPDELASTIPKEALAPRLPYSSVIRGTVSGPLEQEIQANAPHPHFEGSVTIADSRNENDGIRVRLTSQGTLVAPEGVTLSVTEVETPHDLESRIDFLDVE